MSRSNLRVLAVLVATAAGAAGARRSHADLDVLLANDDRVASRIDPPEETETFHVDCPEAAVLTVQVKAKGTPAPKLRVRVLSPDGTTLLHKTSKRVATTKKLTTSGRYVVWVSSGDGAATAEYDVVARWRSRPSWKDPRLLVAPSVPDAFAFAADRGATVSLTASKPRSSRAVPQFGAVAGPKGFSRDVGAASDTFTAPATGDYSVEVVDAGGGAGGKASAVAQVTPRPPSSRALDLRALSTPEGSEPSHVAVVDQSGADLALDLEGLDGLQISIPALALPGSATLLVGPADDLTPVSQGFGVAGPALSCLPEGTTFSTAIAITLPFEADLAGGDTSRVAVVVRSGGSTTEVTSGLVIDLDAGTCTLPVSHFSEYQVFVRDPVFPPGLVDTTTLAGQADASVASGALGGTFRASAVNLSSFSLRLSGDGSAAPVVYGVDGSGTPTGAPLWIGSAFAVPAAATRLTFQPNVELTNDALYFVGATNAAAVQPGLSGAVLSVGVVNANPLPAPANVFSGATTPATAGSANQDVSSEIVMNGFPVRVAAATAQPSDGAAHVTDAAGPRTYGGLFTARDVNLVRFTLDLGPRGAATDTLGIFITDAPGGSPGTTVLWSTTIPEPAALGRFTFEPPAYTVPLVSGATYFLGATIDATVVPGAGGDGFELRSNPNDPLWFQNPLYEGNGLPLTQQGPAARTLSTDVLMNGGR